MSASANIAPNPSLHVLAPPAPAAASVRHSVTGQESWEWAKLRKIALRQMDRFIDLVPLVLRNEDLTAVNRMRITCRRLEQIVELVYVKPRPKHIKKLRRRLKLCRQTLGKLRDCDALLAVADNAIAAKGPDTDAWQALRDYLESLRVQTATATLQKLGHVNLAMPYLRMKRDFALRKHHRNKKRAHGAATHAAAEVVYQRILHSLAGRWHEFASAVEKSHHDPCEHVIHGMRIAAKRLRYLTEVMTKLRVEGSMEALTWLKTLQGTIGVWRDLEIMERLLREIVEHRKSFHLQHPVVAHIDHLIRHHREIKKESSERFFRMTRHSRDYQHVKKWVAGVLASRHAKDAAHA